jgi:uridine kinase
MFCKGTKMLKDFELTNYDYYSNRRNMEIISSIIESLKKILEEDSKQEQPLFLKISDNLIMNIARKVVIDKKQSFLIGITGESASGKTVFVDNTIKACVKEHTKGIYTVIRCDDYYKDTSKELKEAGSYEALFKTGFSFDTPDVIDLDLMKSHLVALKKGETIKSPHYNFVTCESDPNGDEKTPAKIILTEGLYVLNEGVRDIMDVKVYVFTPLEVIKERWYKRAAERGKSGDAADMQFADVNKTAQQYIRPAYQISDAVINGLVSQEYIQEITDKIFKALKNIAW